ncbi:MAG: TolC family protein [Bacteroidales bacterium]|nr:TolC family protein [Bacteroidales bacterium]
MKHILILILFASPAAALTQNTWTLADCINHALQHNIQIQQANIVSQNNQLNWRQARNNRLPAVNANLSDGFGFGRTLGPDNIFINQNSNSADASLNMNVPIFQGSRITHDVAARKHDFMAAVEDHQRIKNDVSLTVVSFFLNVLLQKEHLKIAEQQLFLTDTLLHRTEVLVRSGREPVSRLYELKAQSATDAFNITGAERNLRLALLDLAQLLNLEDVENFNISAPDFDFDISQMPIPVVIFENAMVTLPNVRAEEYRLESSRRNLEIARSAYFPTVSLGASTSTGYFHMFGGDFQNATFSSQIDQNWRSFVGVSVNIPIFNRFAVRTNVSQSRMQIQHQELQVTQARNAIYNDIQRAMLNAHVSRDRYIAAANAVRANQQSFEFVEQAFTAGRTTFFDMQQSRNNLERAQSEQIQAKYEFIFNVKVLDFYNGREIRL